jgi:outer membrane biosynthesis protein TonB
MQLGFFTSLIVCIFILTFQIHAFSQTDESLNNELNAAESAAGGDAQAAPPPKELKSDGDTLDAVGIPSEVGAPQNNALTPVPPKPALKKPVAKSAPPPPPPPAQKAEPVTPEEIPPPTTSPPPAEELTLPPETTTESAPQPEPEVDSLQVETPAPQPEAENTPAPQTAENQRNCNCRFKPGTPYRERRGAITGIFGFEGGTYAPTNFISQELTNQRYSTVYGSSASPNIELLFGAKYNFILGSIGAQLGGGYFSANNQGQSATLTVNPITAGLVYSLDSIFKEPYVVPYLVGGMYTDFWKETAGGLTAQGRTGFGFFYTLGLLFQLDWLDTETHETGYKDFGLENTFLFLEARSFQATNDLPIDFSTPLQISGGFKFEF